MNAVLKEPQKHLLSRDDYYRMAEVGILAPDARVELIEGEIIDMVPIGATHASIVDRLNKLLVYSVGDNAIIRIQNPITLNDFSEPQPDVSVLRPRDDFYGSDNRHPAGSDIILLIEVAVSSLTYDRDRKIPLYATHGVPVVWLIDPEAAEIWEYSELVEDEYQRRKLLSTTSPVVIGQLTECSVDLSGLW